MHLQNTRFFVLLFIWTSSLSFSQIPNKINWSVDTDLLPQNSVKSIVPDKYGYLWLSTENGLVRFDGHRYKTYNGSNLKLMSNRFWYIEGNAASDSLFAMTEYSKDLILIHKRRAKKVAPSEIPNAALHFHKINETINSHGSTPTPVDLKMWKYRLALPSKKYYVVHSDAVHYYSSSGTLLKKIPFKNPNTKLFFTVEERLFYLENARQYAVFHEGSLTRKPITFSLPEKHRLVWNKPCNQVFIKSGGDLLLVKSQNGQLSTQLLVRDNQLPYADITSAYYDLKHRIIYLGSSANGLGTYRIRDFKTISVIDDRQSSLFYASTPFTATTILTSSGFVMSKDSIVASYDFTGREKFDLSLDAAQNVWIKNNNRLYLHRKASNYKSQKHWDFNTRIGTLYRSTSNKIWIALQDDQEEKGRLIYFRPGVNPVFRSYISTDFRINYMHRSLDGKLWLASSKGLHLLDDHHHTLQTMKGTSKLNIRSVVETNPNEVWIATYGDGFYLYKNNRLHRFPLDKNNYLSTAHYVIEDQKGFLWIPTNKGLFQVKKSSLLSYTENRKHRIYYHFYNKDSGFLTNEFNGGTSPFASQLGSQLFLPSMNGMVTFDTEKINPLEPTSPIYLDEIIVDHKISRQQDTLHLPKDYQRVTFDFSSPYFGTKMNANYEVKLDGPNALSWTRLAPDYKFSFTKLDPGQYTLTVRKLAGFDSTYVYKRIVIEITPSFYQTIWFVIIVVFALVLLIYFVAKLYANSIRNRNKLLTRKMNEKTADLQRTISTLRHTKEQIKAQAEKNNKLIQIISHDIKSPLKFMSMASKYMYDDFDANNPDLKDNILAIHTSSSQIYNFLDNILSYSKVNTADGELEKKRFLLCEEVQNKIRFFKNIANAEKTQLINLVPDDLYLNTNNSLFSIIIHNLLDNALKHTSNGTITFTAHQEDDLVALTIKDEGIGMSAETLTYYTSVFKDFDLNKNKSNKRLGLHLVAELLLILNGKIELKSVPGIGTSVTLLFYNQLETESS